MLNAPLPDEIQLEEDLRLCVDADLHADGNLGPEWLAITASKLLVISMNGAGASVRRELPLSEVSEPKTTVLVGGGALEVLHDGARTELIRYSTARAADFASTAQLLEKWLKDEVAVVPDTEVHTCPRCGLPLEKGTRVCPACLPRSRTLRRLIAYLRPCRLQAVILSVLSMVATVLGIALTWLNKPLMDEVLAPQGVAKSMAQRLLLLGVLTLIMMGIHIIRAGISVAQGYLSAWVGNQITHKIRCELYSHLQYLSLRFFDKRQMGSVISRVNQDTSQVQQFLLWGAQDLGMNFLMLGGIGVVLFSMNWRLALMVLAPAPIVIFMYRTMWRRIFTYVHRFFRRWGRVNALLAETLNGLKVVKAFAQERREISRFNQYSAELTTTGVQLERTSSVLFAGTGLFMTLGGLLAWFMGGHYVLGKTMTLGEFMTFNMLVGMFYAPMQWMTRLLDFSSRCLAASERVFEVLDTRPEVQDAAQAVAIPYITGKVEFRDVTFGYERHLQTMKHVSFTVEPGEMIGLVGHSGAGKSTTINLLCRFYDTTDGEILIDNVPIRQLRIEDLRRQIGLVPQDTFLFSGTIAENIAYAKPDATPPEIIQAAKVANAHDFIRQKPDGYETLVGEGGQGLSGGEKQRIAIARAVLHNPRILILDEATSHVDVETEQQIQEATARLVKGRTTFAIAHRLSTLKNADRLLVLKAGEIAEIGTHDELLANEDGEFHRLVNTYQEISKVQVLET